MFLDLTQVTDYDQEVTPFLKNGVILDTSVLLIIIEGLISARFSKKRHEEYEKIERFLDRIKINGRWEKFFITPHILTETARHIRDAYRKSERDNYGAIVAEIFSVLKTIQEHPVGKDEFIQKINFKHKHPALDAGDISIFVVADGYLVRKEKVAIFSNDRELNGRYKDDPRVMILDYQSAIMNAS